MRDLLALSDSDARVRIALDRTPPLFAVGEAVGIVTGMQAVGGPRVTGTGTVIGYNASWDNAPVDYLVREDRSGEDFVYAGYFLRSVRQVCESRGIPTAADGWPVIGDPIWQENVNGTGNLITTMMDDCARDRADRIRRGACVDCDDSGMWDDGTRCISCAVGTLATITDLLAPRGWDEIAADESREREASERRQAAMDEDYAAIGDGIRAAMQRHPAGKGRRLAEARVIAGEYVADRLTGDSVRVLARNYPARVYVTAP
jgi:hypothetical protein